MFDSAPPCRITAKLPRLRSGLFYLGALIGAVSAGGNAQDLLVSGNDGKYADMAGKRAGDDKPNDSLTVIDVGRVPARIVDEVGGLRLTIQGPPQAVAITPDGQTAFVGAPSSWDFATGRERLDTYLQVIDLTHRNRVTRVELGAHPNGLAVSPDGSLLLAACVDGSVRVLRLADGIATPAGSVKLTDQRLSSVAFTHDGAAALVSRRDEGGLNVLNISGSKVIATSDLVTTGIGPFAISVASDGHWAVVGNQGLAALAGPPGHLVADADTVTLVDVSQKPFRAVEHITVPATPEGVAISPDGKWIAVQSLDGSNLAMGSPGYHRVGIVSLYAVRNGHAALVSRRASSAIAQGIVFSKDSRRIYVQFNNERSIAVYPIVSGKLGDIEQRIQIPASPVSLGTMPR